MRFSPSIVVRKDGIDIHDHVNNEAYLQCIQDVTVEHRLLAAAEDMREKYTWDVLRHEIDYMSPAYLGDRLEVETWAGRATRIKCERFTIVKRGEKVLSEVTSLLVFARLGQWKAKSRHGRP